MASDDVVRPGTIEMAQIAPGENGGIYRWGGASEGWVRWQGEFDNVGFANPYLPLVTATQPLQLIPLEWRVNTSAAITIWDNMDEIVFGPDIKP